jgi:DNA polymerase/3'-5' exonuclease PolX
VELSAKLAEIKNNNTGKKRDFVSAWSDLEREKFQHESGLDGAAATKGIGREDNAIHEYASLVSYYNYLL